MNLPKFITHKEIMLVYGLSKSASKHKLMIIRSVLSKERHQNILVPEFCKAENISEDIFMNELKKEYSKLFTPKQTQQTLLNYT